MVTRTRLSVTYYVNRPPCLKLLFHRITYSAYTYITRRSMPFCLISALTISQTRLTAIFSRGVNPVSGSGTSRAGFVPPPARELDIFPMSDITGRFLESTKVKGELALRWSTRHCSLVQFSRFIPCSNPLQKDACE